MKQIEERKKNKKTFYFIDGNRTTLHLKRDKDFPEIRFHLFRDNESIPEFDLFINDDLSNHSYDTRRKQAHTILLFYIFIDYSECDIYNLGKKDILDLINFLAGNSEKLDRAILITKRNAISVSGLLSIIRNYLYSLNIENKYLGSPSSKKSVKEATKLIKQEVEGSLRYGEATNEYITKDDFKKLIDITKKEHDLTSEIILRMQYEYGFRIGEVLGLTLEDIFDPIIVNPYEYHYSLVLRDRITDKSYQHFRQKFSVAGLKKEKAENTIKYIDNNVMIDDQLYSLLKNYISETKHDVKLDYCEAENLTKKYSVNYYIFISKTGHVLSDQLWNQRLREYFKRASIIADKDVSKSNLNNRLRRGFIANRIKELQDQGVSIEEIKKILAYELRYVDTYYVREFIKNFSDSDT